jgi:hypothetical protein
MLPSDPELHPIAHFCEGLSKAQVQTVRERLIAEIASLEAGFPERRPIDDPGRFALERDRATCARRRREAEFLQRLLDEPSVVA